MAVSISILSQDNGGASGQFTTADITWSGGIGVLFCASAWDTTIANPSHTATGWTGKAHQQYRLRRGQSALYDESPSNGTITVTASEDNGQTYQDSLWFVAEISGSDGTFPTNFDTANDAGSAETGPQTVSLTDTIDSGDLAVFFGMCESSTASHGVDTGLTLRGSVETSSNTRSGLVGDTTTDTTPGHTWTGSNGHGEMAAVFNVATGGGAAQFRVRLVGSDQIMSAPRHRGHLVH